MPADRGVSHQKREPNGNHLALAYLRSQCGSLFRRGFQLTLHRQQLYVRTAGTKVPLRLDITASWQQVQERCAALQQYVAMLDAAQLVRRMATTRTNRSILTRMKREAVTIALHLPDEQAFEGVVARGLDYRPLGPQTGTIPEPPRFQLF